MIIAKRYCQFCSELTDFMIEDTAVLLREARCINCGASIRNNDVYSMALEYYRDKDISNLTVLNTSSYGAIHTKLMNIFNETNGHYYYSEYYDDIENGNQNQNGVYCVNLCQIPFRKNIFDLIITEDIFEHIAGAKQAFLEIERVLKKGGVHVFSVPINENIKTRFRPQEEPRVMHGDGLRENGIPVFYEFGYDLCEFAKTRNTRTYVNCLHRFYAPHQTTDLIRDYADYLKFVDRPLQFYKYNSIICLQVKK